MDVTTRVAERTPYLPDMQSSEFDLRPYRYLNDEFDFCYKSLILCIHVYVSKIPKKKF